MTQFTFDKQELIQQNGNAIEVLGPHTGHGVRPVAFCENSTIARQIVEALRLWSVEHNKAVEPA
jgi:hypothetical protein